MDALDTLVARVWDTSAHAALMEAHRYLCLTGEHAAADKLLERWDLLVAQTVALRETQLVIQRAKETTKWQLCNTTICSESEQQNKPN